MACAHLSRQSVTTVEPGSVHERLFVLCRTTVFTDQGSAHACAGTTTTGNHSSPCPNTTRNRKRWRIRAELWPTAQIHHDPDSPRLQLPRDTDSMTRSHTPALASRRKHYRHSATTKPKECTHLVRSTTPADSSRPSQVLVGEPIRSRSATAHYDVSDGLGATNVAVGVKDVRLEVKCVPSLQYVHVSSI